MFFWDLVFIPLNKIETVFHLEKFAGDIFLYGDLILLILWALLLALFLKFVKGISQKTPSP